MAYVKNRTHPLIVKQPTIILKCGQAPYFVHFSIDNQIL